MDEDWTVLTAVNCEVTGMDPVLEPGGSDEVLQE